MPDQVAKVEREWRAKEEAEKEEAAWSKHFLKFFSPQQVPQQGGHFGESCYRGDQVSQRSFQNWAEEE